jgi:hypothetical protein
MGKSVNTHAQKEIHKAMDHLRRWAETDAWRERQEQVFDEYFTELADRLGYELDAFMDLLIEYDLIGPALEVCLEDFMTRRFGPDGSNVIEDFLKRRGWREGVRGRRYLRQLLESKFSLYEVTGVVPGRYCDLVELAGAGRRLRVYESSGTQTLVQWDRIAARVLPGDGEAMFSGAVMPLSNETADRVLRVLAATHDGIAAALKYAAADRLELAGFEVSDDDILTLMPKAFTQLWLLHWLDTIERPAPELSTTDGEPLVFATTRFAVDAARRAEVIELLDAAPEWDRDPDDDALQWAWLSDNQEGAVILAFLEMTGDFLELRCHSRSRSEAAVENLQNVLGERVEAAFTQYQDPRQLLAEAGAEDPSPPLVEVGDGDVDQAELDRLLKTQLDRHYRQTLDEPIPMLGDRSPRECVQDAAGSAEVVAWLKYLENQEHRQARRAGAAPYDFGWMWQELGLSRPKGG